MKKKIIIGNWKTNPASLEEAKKLFLMTRRQAQKLSSQTEVVIVPPFIYLIPLSKLAEKVSLGAQTVSIFTEGPHTGEISAPMLKNVNVKYCIVGHSERRQLGDTDHDISKKVRTLLEADIIPVLCVGESTRDDQGNFFNDLKGQIIASLSGISKADISKIIFAYEPVWAVGGKIALGPKDVHESMLFIRKVIAEVYDHEIAMNIRIIYGGSVNVRDVRDIVELGEVDGVILGRDSLNKINFPEIIKIISEIKNEKN